MNDAEKVIEPVAAAGPEKPGVDAVRFDPETPFRREISFEAETVDPDKRVVALSFSSELPVLRGSFFEVLSHDPADVDLSRLNDAHPLLLSHDPEKQIGVVERASVGEDKKGRATVRFSKSQLGTEIWNDVKDGIRRLVSVGYHRIKELATETRDGVEFVRFAWQPYEVSIVSVPADASVGVGRADETKPATVPEKDCKIMSENKIEAVKETAPDNRANEINSIAGLLDGKMDGVKELAARAICQNQTVAEFREELKKNMPEPKVLRAPRLDVSDKEFKHYSLARALTGAGDGKLSGFELEMHDELNKSMPAKGNLLIPHAMLCKRDAVVHTATLGGNIKGTDLLDDQFIELLRNKALALQLGARVISGLQRDIAIPRQTTASTVYWATEGATSTETNINFDQVALAPKGATAWLQYSKNLLVQGTPGIDGLVRDDFVRQIALAIDSAILYGATGGPTGIYATSGVGLTTVSTNGGSFLTMGPTAYAHMISLEQLCAVGNAEVSSMAYVTNPQVRGQLKRCDISAATNTGRFVWTDSGTPGLGMVNGWNAHVTNQVAADRTVGSGETCSSVIFGDFSQIIYASWGSGIDVLVDPYVNAATRLVNVYATQFCDAGIRHPAAFAVCKGINAY